ncbi:MULTISPECIES: phage integrase SAM-like domain-containing protein [Pseudoalteromonas]|uniref:phage integrase SAM-like domain-containing protein n=1 Tax=Pseudoalteromonas TaxID=53246 RepID=UPI001140CC44
MRTIQAFKHNLSLVIRYKSIETIHELDKAYIESFIIHAKIDRNRSPKTIKNCLCYLTLFLKRCVNEGYIDDNPAHKIARPKVPRRELRGLSAEDATSLIEHAKNLPTVYSFYRER